MLIVIALPLPPGQFGVLNRLRVVASAARALPHTRLDARIGELPNGTWPGCRRDSLHDFRDPIRWEQSNRRSE
jgi:hypothetical protein